MSNPKNPYPNRSQQVLNQRVKDVVNEAWNQALSNNQWQNHVTPLEKAQWDLRLSNLKPRSAPWLPLSQTPAPRSPSEVVLNSLLNYKQTLFRWLKPLSSLREARHKTASSCREPSSRKTK